MISTTITIISGLAGLVSLFCGAIGPGLGFFVISAFFGFFANEYAKEEAYWKRAEAEWRRQEL